MRRALAFTVVSILFARTASAEPTTVEKGRSVAPLTQGGLARVGATKGSATATAGPSREAATATAGPRVVTVREAPATKTERPLATQRILRRMNAERMSFAAEMQTCASLVGTTAPTTVILRLSVTPGGAVEHVELASATASATATAPAPAQPLVDCVVGAVSSARFGAPGGAGAIVALRIEVPAAPKPSIAATQPSTTTTTTAAAADARTAGR
jgi:hypothetical protein